jgi:hypothetical protein
METVETGCDHFRIDGWVYKADGSRADGVTVQLQWGSEPLCWETGSPMEEPGYWKFTPLAYGPALGASTTFIVRIVRNESDPTPLSADFRIDYQGCGDGPELFLNIIFDEL